MKKIVISIIAMLMIIMLISCKQGRVNKKNESRRTKSDLKTFEQKSSYTFGIDLAKKMSASPEFEYESFLQGFKDQIEGKKYLLTLEEIAEIKNENKKVTLKKQEERKNWIKPENNAILSEKFLLENKEKPGIIETESGLQYKVIKQGKGRKPKLDDTVVVHYVGTLRRGEEFDNSHTTGKPIKFKLGDVIKGWQEGLQLMPEGSKYILYIPPKLGYGDKGTGKISPNSLLIFEIELLQVIKNENK